MTYAPEMQVKQYVAIVRSKSGQRFQVFKTGSEKHYLFCALIGESSIAGGLQFPVLKADLRPDIRRTLSHGWGNSL